MKPPYFILTGKCRNERCDNHGKEFSRESRKATYESTANMTLPRTDVSCPLCLSWAKIVSIQEVGPEKCPDCGAILIHRNGCLECPAGCVGCEG